MIQHKSDSASHRLLSSSGPGGAAQQFRVQCLTPYDDWHLAASFCSRGQAVEYAHELECRGEETRIIENAICPVAG